MREEVTERLEEYRRQIAKLPLWRDAADALVQGGVGQFDEEQLLYLSVYAPVLTAYVEWVLQNAMHAGKKRLYFLARDAYPMYVTAQRICRERSYFLECRYLRVSRYAVRLPEYQLLRENCVERICVGGIGITFEKILRRAGLTEKECAEIAALCGCEAGRTLTYPEIVRLKKKLKNTPCFLQYTYSHSKAAFADAIGYLEQEGLFEDLPYALVDSGWTGTLQQSMQNLLRTRQRDRLLEGYYFGLYEIPRGESPEQYHSFYFGPRGKIKRKAAFSNCLFETIFSCAEGMTRGYKKENGRFEAVFGSANPNAETLRKNEAALDAYLRAYLSESQIPRRRNLHGQSDAAADRPAGRIGGARDDMAALCEGLLSPAMGRPRKWEAEVCGSSLFCDDVLEGAMQCVAARLTESDIKRQRLFFRIPAMLGLCRGSVKDSAWMEGSIVREKGECAPELRSAAGYKRLVYIRKAMRRW